MSVRREAGIIVSTASNSVQTISDSSANARRDRALLMKLKGGEQPTGLTADELDALVK